MRLFHKRHPPVGARPGTLVVPETTRPPTIHVMQYNADGCREQTLSSVAEVETLDRDGWITWIDVNGISDEAALRRIGQLFSLHNLVLEDIANAPQRPKQEAYDDYHFIIARMARMPAPGELDIEQVAIVLGSDYVITFQEKEGDVFDPVRGRMRDGKGVMRKHGADYLAYCLFDIIIDAYFPLLESLGDYLEQLEIDTIENPTPRVLQKLHRTRTLLLLIRRALWPQREAAGGLSRDDSDLITDPVRVYFRDTYDHCVQSADVAESYRELVTGLLNTYLSAIGNRANDIMKVLTIIATIFIPLTFMAGIYGMNFAHMPELQKEWAYPVLLAAMAVVAIAMLVFFRVRGWLGGRDKDNGG